MLIAVLSGSHTDDLQHVLMGGATRNPKVVAISIGSLQRLIGLRLVPQSAVPLIVMTMNDCLAHPPDASIAHHWLRKHPQPTLRIRTSIPTEPLNPT